MSKRRYLRSQYIVAYELLFQNQFSATRGEYNLKLKMIGGVKEAEDSKNLVSKRDFKNSKEHRYINIGILKKEQSATSSIESTVIDLHQE